VGTQEVAADLAAAALLAMGSNRARSRGLFSNGKSERLSAAIRYLLNRGELAISFSTTRTCRQRDRNICNRLNLMIKPMDLLSMLEMKIFIRNASTLIKVGHTPVCTV